MGTQRVRSTIFKSVHIPGAKHYKIHNDKKTFIFSGISKRQFEDIPNGRNPLKVNQGVTIGGTPEEVPTGNEMIDFAGYDEVTVTGSNP